MRYESMIRYLHQLLVGEDTKRNVIGDAINPPFKDRGHFLNIDGVIERQSTTAAVQRRNALRAPKNEEYTDIAPQLSKHLKKNINSRHGIEEIQSKGAKVAGRVLTLPREAAAEAAERASDIPGNLFTDGLRLDSGYCGSSVAWKTEDNE